MGSMAQKAAAKLAQSSDSKLEQDRLASERSARLRSEAPYIWERLKEILAEEAGDFNKLGQGNISVTRERTRVEMRFTPVNDLLKGGLTVTFDATVPVITFTKFTSSGPVESPMGRLTFATNSDRTSVGLKYHGSDLLSEFQGAEYLFNMVFE